MTLTWHKSSYSHANGACVEVAVTERPAPASTVREHARAALELLRYGDWCKEGPPAGSGAMENCLLTACSEVCADPWDLRPLLKAVASVIRSRYPQRLTARERDYGGQLITFNDHPDTVFPDVEAVLEKVISSHA